ncbi:MAG: AAA family ATPase [Lachnospiraceae bacterium]|nr:AAA family ATPase [Lachnospiraceae bacterium]
MTELVNRAWFEERIRADLGEFEVRKLCEGVEQYTMTRPFESKNRDLSFFIEDKRGNGINISFTNHILQKQQTIEKIYHWSDVYRLLYKALVAPQNLKYQEKNPQKPDIRKTLGACARNYPFRWCPKHGLCDVSDELLETAIELVKYDFVEEIEYNYEADMDLIIHGADYPCQNDKTFKELLSRVKTGRALLEETKLEWNTESELMSMCQERSCNEQCCILVLCAYLEYVISNDGLEHALKERKEIRDKYRTVCGDYQFYWEAKDGLRFVDESRFQLAKMLVENGLVELERELNDGNFIRIHSQGGLVYRMPGEESGGLPRGVTTCIIASNVSTQTWEQGENNGNFAVKIDAPLNTYIPFVEHCGNGKYVESEQCVYVYAAYIKYLMDCGREEKITQDREWYATNKLLAEKEIIGSGFCFKLSSETFINVSPEIFEVAELLQENNYVALEKEARDWEYYAYMDADRPVDFIVQSNVPEVNEEDSYGDLQLLRKQCLEHTIDRRKLYRYTEKEFWPKKVEKKKFVIYLAAYIDYLRKTGQYEEYREFLNAREARVEELFTVESKEIPDLEKVLAIAKNENESGLYCVIEGERGVGKKKIVDRIARLLIQKGKIDRVVGSRYDCRTFEEFSTELGYIQGYVGGAATMENTFGVYKGLDKRKLYVLTGLKEFLYKSQKAMENDGSKISHMIKLLGTYQPETYIIIIGEKKYVEKFLGLSPQIKFLFGSHVIPVPNLATEKLFSIYSDKVSEALKKQLIDHPEFKNQFIEYIALNRKLLPLGNQELADYLANYSSVQKALVLPPDVYRKQSAKEMLGDVIGMENVKKTAYEFEKYMIFLKRAEMEGLEIPNSNMHMIFAGNPGTGKTMIARVIGQMLYDLGIVGENKVVEVERKDLIAGYIGQTAAKTTEVIERAIGGVLFIDEAYTLVPSSERDFSTEAIATLIKAMEDHKHDLVVIFAGYDKEMHEFLNINPGIASRIGYTFHFDDYSTEELILMFDRKMKKAGFIYDEDVLDKVLIICEHFGRKKNFGNGRFVDRLMQRVIVKHSMGNLDSDSVRYIGKDEIPSIEEMVSTDVVENRDYRKHLDEFIGMENVKNKVHQFAKYVEFQQSAKEAGAVIPAGNMHMIFSGNPGTGKTAIARVMVELLYDIGVVKENKLIEVERKDLVAEHIGQTATKTSEVIERAIDGVLFIDEAYTLIPSSEKDFGAEAIATLIKAMEDHKQDLIVIFAGYEEEMRQFLNVNPGIASRIGNTFVFDDYTPDELVQMYVSKMEQAGFTLSSEAVKKVRIVFEYFSKRKNFGNGRFVGRLQQETFLKHSLNVGESKEHLLMLDAEDIPEIAELNNTPKEVKKSISFDNIIGMDSVKEKIKEFEALINFKIKAREHGLMVPDANMHMIFTGNAGTGKTMIARLIAQKLYDIGVIMENKLIEVERKDLVGSYIGETAPKVADVIERAMGGVLFIDEAYTLTPKSEQDFGGEAIATLIKAMADHKDDLVVIYAGYKEEMQDFIESNQGIASRIGFTFHFEDYSADELTEIFIRKMTSCGFTVTEAAIAKANRVVQHFCHVKNFGNGRFVERMIQNVITIHSMNYVEEVMEIIDEADIPDISDIKKSMC